MSEPVELWRKSHGVGYRRATVEDGNLEAAAAAWIKTNGGNLYGLLPEVQTRLKERMSVAVAAWLGVSDAE